MTMTRPKPTNSPRPESQPRIVLSDGILIFIGVIVILLAALILTILFESRLSLDRRAQPAIDLEAEAKRKDETTPWPTNSRATIRATSTGGVLIARPTSTLTPARDMYTETPRPTETLPAEVLLREVPIGRQTRTLNCEFQTASDLAWYYGKPYTWEEIFQLVGHDPGGNPHKGFVGRSLDDKPGQLYPYGYGVYAEPIAEALRQLGLKATVFYNSSREWLMAQLADGRPVMIWATSEMTIRPVATWTASDGTVVKGVAGEHTFLAIGYNTQGVWLIDPWEGQRRHFGWNTFLASWDLLDRMAIVITDEVPSSTPLTPLP